jgi:serine/threonine protein kinase
VLNDTDIDGLDKFLASSGKDAFPRVQEYDNILAAGATLGSWRVEAFLGRGGSGEVYRVVHSVTRTPAAAKVLTRDDEVMKKRFQDEIDFLAQNQLPQFPRYFESGECDGRVYLVLELLEPIDVPTDEKGIAEYLTDVCLCVRALHLSGIVHRDLKPKNIMRRSSGEVVLIDFGLAKDTFVSARPRTDVSIVSGKAIGVGTPEYAAPEQLTGGEISPAADIHALGRIANAAFGGNPPRLWETIIRRATSSIPAQRYETVDAFATAIRNRNRFRKLARIGLAVGSIAVLAGVFFGREDIPLVRDVVQQSCFDALGETISTNVVVQQLLWEKLETNKLGMVFLKERAFRNVTNAIDVTLVRLNRGTNVFVRPMQLKPNYEYWVIGPGILDASVTSAGTNTIIRLKNCVFLNRSSVPFKKTGIRYIFQGGAYLNFTNMDRPEDFTTLQFEGFDGAFDEIRFKGPETIKGLNELRNKESWERLKKDASNHRFGPDKNFFHFPRHILCSKPEYIMESMEKKDTKAALGDEGFDFHLDPNRIRTNAEIQLFADVFSISFDEARQILNKAGRKCQS